MFGWVTRVLGHCSKVYHVKCQVARLNMRVYVEEKPKKIVFTLQTEAHQGLRTALQFFEIGLW